MQARLEFKSDKSNKFWECSVEGNVYKARSGSLTSSEPTEHAPKVMGSPAEAAAYAEKMLRSKLKKGYVCIASDGFEKVATSDVVKAAIKQTKPPKSSTSSAKVLTGAALEIKTEGAKAGAEGLELAPLTNKVLLDAAKPIRESKRCKAEDIARVLKTLDGGKVSDAEARTFFSELLAIIGRSDFFKHTFAGLKYKKLHAAVLDVAQGIAKAGALGLDLDAPLAKFAKTFGAKSQGSSVGIGGLVEIVRAGETSDELRPIAKVLMCASMDRVLETGREAQGYMHPEGSGYSTKQSSTFFWADGYVASLEAQADPASPEGTRLARGLARLEDRDWLPEGTTHDYLAQSKTLAKATAALMSAFTDGKHTILADSGSLSGFDEANGQFYVPRGTYGEGYQNFQGGSLLRGEKGAALEALSNTEQYKPRAVRVFGDQLFVLTENTKQNGVAHLQVFDRETGEKVGSNVVPKPLNHLKGHSLAMTEDGALLYPSSEGGSQDPLGQLRVSINEKGKVKLDPTNVPADSTEGTKRTGFKLSAVTVHGDHAYGALEHANKGELRLIEYPLADLSKGRALATVPNPTGRHFFDSANEIAVNDDVMLVAGQNTLVVFDRDGEDISLRGALPVGARDLHLRAA